MNPSCPSRCHWGSLANAFRVSFTEIKIDSLLDFLKTRYGICIDCLPEGSGYRIPSIQDRSALRKNKEIFKNRLREIGFYQDLSDAYITQNIYPRYKIEE